MYARGGTDRTTPKHTSLSSNPSTKVYLDGTANRALAVLVLVGDEGEVLDVLVVVFEAVVVDTDVASVLSQLEQFLPSSSSIPLQRLVALWNSILALL